MNDAPVEPPRPVSHGPGAVDPILVLILNLFAAGCGGYFRIGQTQKGIVAAIIFIALAFPTMCVGSFLFSALTALDAYGQAEQLLAGRTIGQWTWWRNALR